MKQGIRVDFFTDTKYLIARMLEEVEQLLFQNASLIFGKNWKHLETLALLTKQELTKTL